MADTPNGAPAAPALVQIVITYDVARNSVNLQSPTDNWVMVFGMLSMAEKMLDGGVTLRDIAKALGVSTSRAAQICSMGGTLRREMIRRRDIKLLTRDFSLSRCRSVELYDILTNFGRQPE